jgi:CRISPR-associated protein Cas2
MKRYDFIITYDIADTKRLKKIAKLIEKNAMRIQYSVYIYFDATQQEVTKLLVEVCKLYHAEYDDIRVYKIKNRGLHFGAAVDLDNPFDIL